eukprot:6411715-Pyramimonas_sp.AAC.1
MGAVRLVLRGARRIKVSRCHDDATRHRRSACFVFAEAPSRCRLLRSVLRFLPDGDWRRQGAVEVHVDDEAALERRHEIAPTIATALAQTLANS